MGFLDALSRFLKRQEDHPTTNYDRVQWRKKLTRLLEQLPASQKDWEPLMSEARALGFEPGWVKARSISRCCSKAKTRTAPMPPFTWRPVAA